MLKKDEGILSMRGHCGTNGAQPTARMELPALPTLHPAFLLRQPVAKKRAWQPIC